MKPLSSLLPQRLLAGHTPDCDEAEVCISQREPESGTDKDRFIVGSRFWSPLLRSKALILSNLNPSPHFTYPEGSHMQPSKDCDVTGRAAHRPEGFESLELLQEGGKLLLLRWRQVPQSHLFPEPTLLEGAAVERKTGMRGPPI